MNLISEGIVVPRLGRESCEEAYEETFQRGVKQTSPGG
jgi:hypothetical protein